MYIFKKSGDINEYLDSKKINNITIGFVPTMGALHEGHLSLIRTSKSQNGITICSIFVNPTQFNDPEDFKKYPITIEDDIRLLESAGCDILFLPGVNDIYPEGLDHLSKYDLGFIETILEGKFRPGHFQGVCQVVHVLLSIVKPDNLYMGQKDFQQCMVIKKLIILTGMHFIKLHICPTLRENDGLAMSSRNRRLNAEEREKATAIFKALFYIRDNLKTENFIEVKKEASRILVQNDFITDYLEIADASSFKPLEKWDGKQKIVALTAAFINGIRLIDNILINP